MEGGLLSYGNDMTIKDNVLECGFGGLVSFSDEIDYLAKDHLKQLSLKGIKKSLTGIKIFSDAFTLLNHEPIFVNGDKVGELRSVVYSPSFKCCLGIAMIDMETQDNKQKQIAVIDNNEYQIEISPLPFNQ